MIGASRAAATTRPEAGIAGGAVATAAVPERARDVGRRNLGLEVLGVVAIFVALQYGWGVWLWATGQASMGAFLDQRYVWQVIFLGSLDREVTYHAAFLLMAWVASFVVGRWRFGLTWRAAFGATLLVYMFLRAFWSTLPDLQVAVAGGTVLRPLSEARLYWIVNWKAFRDLVMPGFAVLLLFGAVPFVQAPAHMALGRARRALAAVQVRLKHSWHRDLVHGLWLSLVIIALTILLQVLLDVFFPQTRTGDDTAVFNNVTPLLVLLISLAAAVGEEFVFRGVLQTGLARVLYDGPQRIVRAAAMTVAVIVQAVLFGLVHAGYGNVQHIIGPAALGLVLGVVVLRFGLLPAIMVHFLLDVVALSYTNAFLTSYPWFGVILGGLLLACFWVPAIYFLYVLVDHMAKGAERRGGLLGRLGGS